MEKSVGSKLGVSMDSDKQGITETSLKRHRNIQTIMIIMIIMIIRIVVVQLQKVIHRVIHRVIHSTLNFLIILMAYVSDSSHD